jgi:hypothetical protein
MNRWEVEVPEPYAWTWATQALEDRLEAARARIRELEQAIADALAVERGAGGNK